MGVEGGGSRGHAHRFERESSRGRLRGGTRSRHAFPFACLSRSARLSPLETAPGTLIPFNQTRPVSPSLCLPFAGARCLHGPLLKKKEKSTTSSEDVNPPARFSRLFFFCVLLMTLMRNRAASYLLLYFSFTTLLQGIARNVKIAFCFLSINSLSEAYCRQLITDY